MLRKTTPATIFAILVVFLASAAAGDATEVVVSDRLDTPVDVAFSYVDAATGRVTTKGWFRVGPGEVEGFELDADENHEIYAAAFNDGVQYYDGFTRASKPVARWCGQGDFAWEGEDEPEGDGRWKAKFHPVGYEENARVVRIDTDDSGELLESMADDDWRALNVFFSNFSETGLENFNAKEIDEKTVILFAVQHNVINNRELFKMDEESNYYIEPKYINATINKYFGIEKITPQDGGDFVPYRDDRYYWDDVFEGSPWFAGAQTLSLRENGDGTLSAIVEDYGDDESYQKDPESGLIPRFYSPKSSWPEGVAELFKVTGYHAAIIAPHTHDGRRTYKLLQWRAAKTFDEAETIVALGLF